MWSMKERRKEGRRGGETKEGSYCLKRSNGDADT